MTVEELIDKLNKYPKEWDVRPFNSSNKCTYDLIKVTDSFAIYQDGLVRECYLEFKP
jgi:hypothetical protein